MSRQIFLMISDQLIRHCLLGRYGKLVVWFEANCQYDLEDLIQECRLYLAKRPLHNEQFAAAHVKHAMTDLIRQEVGQPRKYATREKYERESARYLRSKAVMHSLDNDLDPVACNLVFVEPDVSDLPSIMATAMQVLSLREWWVIVCRFWFEEDWVVIGRRWGVTQGRACQIFTKSAQKLRRALPPKGDLI